MDNTTRSITCDYCSKELIVNSSYPSHYVLKLTAVDYGRNASGFMYDISTREPDPDRHFCDLGCLKSWATASEDGG